MLHAGPLRSLALAATLTTRVRLTSEAVTVF
jgi:hypothetical protein